MFLSVNRTVLRPSLRALRRAVLGWQFHRLASAFRFNNSSAEAVTTVLFIYPIYQAKNARCIVRYSILVKFFLRPAIFAFAFPTAFSHPD